MPHPWELEQRFCKCGCGKSFKCLPTSVARYASSKHKNLSKLEEKELSAKSRLYGLDDDYKIECSEGLGLLD